MGNHNLILGILLLVVPALFVFLPSVSANGLQVLPASIYANKTIGVDYQTALTVFNQEPFTFYNISFSDPVISIPTISNLTSGSNITVMVTIRGDAALNETARLKGYYPATVGQSSKVYDLNVSAFKSSKCDFTVIKGDTVRWTNSLLSDIVMVNADTGIAFDGAVIKNNQTYPRPFSDAGSFRYYFTILGSRFPETCTITILSDTGVVNDPQLDALLSLTVAPVFEPTTLAATFPVVNYSMQFFESQDGVFTLTNTGTKTAKNVALQAPWFSFSKNNFDIAPGETKAVAYTITPAISITNDTNQTYERSLSVNGNFPAITQSFSIFIKYAVIDGNLSDVEDIQKTLGAFCDKHPKSQFCDPDPKVLYQTVGNGSNAAFNLTVTQQEWRNFQLAALEEKEILQTQSNFFKEQYSKQAIELSAARNETSATRNDLAALRKDMLDTQQGSTRFLGIVGGVVAAGMLFALITHYRDKKQQEALKRW